MGTIRNPHRERWTTVDRQLINDDSLSFRAKGIMVWLLDKPDGWNFSATKLADGAKEGRDAVRSALAELEAAGYVVRTKAQNRSGRWITYTDLCESPGRTGDGKPGVGLPDSGSLGPQEKTVNEDCHQTPPHRPSSDDVQRDISFDAFWEMYPRKVKKKDARRAFDKIDFRDIHSAPAVIATALAERVRWWAAMATPIDKIPYPASWLNGERWADVIEPVAAKRARVNVMPDGVRQWMVRRDGEWWSRYADNVERAWQVGDRLKYDDGELAVRLAIQLRIDQRVFESGGEGQHNFILTRVPNVSRFAGALPMYVGAPKSYAELMDLAHSRGTWVVR